MRILPTTIRRAGMTLRQLRRESDVVLLEVSRDTIDHPIGFEVARVKSHNGYEFMGRPVEPAEFLPSDSDWGIDGFSYPINRRDQADARFALMLEGPASAVPRSERRQKMTLKLKLKK